jgi:hypothetical protein
MTALPRPGPSDRRLTTGAYASFDPARTPGATAGPRRPRSCSKNTLAW